MQHWCMVLNVAFWPDGKTLVMSGGIGPPGEAPEVVLWDLATRKKVRTLQPPANKVSLAGESFTTQAFSADGKLWATGCADNTIKVWRLDRPELARSAGSIHFPEARDASARE